MSYFQYSSQEGFDRDRYEATSNMVAIIRACGSERTKDAEVLCNQLTARELAHTSVALAAFLVTIMEQTDELWDWTAMLNRLLTNQGEEK